MTLADKWILSRVNSLIDSITKKIANYQFGEAGQELYEFTWHELADWYLEISKFQSSDSKLESSTELILNYISATILKLLHPFIPFATEQIYQQTVDQNSLLMITSWPKSDKKFINLKAEKKIEQIKILVAEIRNWKTEQKIPFKQEGEYKIEKENQKVLTQNLDKNLIEKLTNTKIVFA